MNPSKGHEKKHAADWMPGGYMTAAGGAGR